LAFIVFANHSQAFLLKFVDAEGENNQKENQTYTT